MSEQKERTYYNFSSLKNAQRGRVGEAEHPVLKLAFTAFDRQAKELTTKYATLFLTEENNDRNRETLQLLGVKKPPAVCNLDNMTDDNLVGLGSRTVDLVAEVNNAGYENVKYINEPKFSVRVWDMK